MEDVGTTFRRGTVKGFTDCPVYLDIAGIPKSNPIVNMLSSFLRSSDLPIRRAAFYLFTLARSVGELLILPHELASI